MNAVNPLQAATGPRSSERSPDRQAEPSMEEILASIRRIIADDQVAPNIEPVAAAPPAFVELPSTSPAPPYPGPSSLRAALRARSLAEPPAAADEGADGLAGYGQVLAPQFPSPEGPALEGEADSPPSIASAPRVGSASGPSPETAAALAPTPPRRDDAPPFSLQDTAMRDQLARDPGIGRARDLQAEAPRPASLISATTDQSLSAAFNMLAATRLADDSEELRAMAREMIRPLLKTWLDDNLPSLVERLVRAEIERVARGGR